nr:heat shock protein Hsp20 [uncultured bacterium]
MNLVKKQTPWFPSLLDELFHSSWNIEVPALNQLPPVNIIENDRDFLVSLAVPGKTKDDFEIAIDNGILSLASKEKKEKVLENGKFKRKEFDFNYFKRSFILPDSVDSSNIDCHYKNGVLQLTLPKYEEAQPQPRKLISVK